MPDDTTLFTLADIRAWSTAHGKELARPSLRVLTRYVTEGRGEPGAVAKGAEPVVGLLPRLVDIHGEPAVCEALIGEAGVRDGRLRWHVPRAMRHRSLLLAVARSGSGAWLGGDCDDDERQVAVQRLTIHSVAAEVRKDGRDRVGDVVLSAPYDVVRHGESLDRTVRALRAGTRGIHLSPNDLLTHRWDRERRRRLVREGVVEAVVELPGGLYEGRAIRPALWLRGRPGRRLPATCCSSTPGTPASPTAGWAGGTSSTSCGPAVPGRRPATCPNSGSPRSPCARRSSSPTSAGWRSGPGAPTSTCPVPWRGTTVPGGSSPRPRPRWRRQRRCRTSRPRRPRRGEPSTSWSTRERSN